MFQWTEKSQPQQDGFTILILFIFVMSVYLFRKNTQQFRLLLSFWQFKSYLNIYGKEKYTNALNYFNLILIVISITNFSLLGYFFYEKILKSFLGGISFLTFFGLLSALVIIRYCLLNLIFRFSGLMEFYHQIIFKSISFYGWISLYSLFFFLFYYYSYITETLLLLITLIMILCSVFLYHFSIYFRIIRMNPNFLVYLILYLCAFKIAPWLWLYKLIY